MGCGTVPGDGSVDRFPIGMRVLAVDDDPICLKVLETLLRKCHYYVETTNQAIEALRMLRENRNKFDLVISDVNMPDMDGFKLLELLGLEMDLPVIMLSAHSDTKLVMKGITHGACDYLLKPVRIEELKNVWQHVVRRKKVDPMDQNKAVRNGNGESGDEHGFSMGGGNEVICGKRKDKNEDEDEEGEEESSDCENDDPSTQKKPRVVWSIELHRKFVAAVDQLGLEKAVPKKILDVMNVEGLTRENVASHLQKYRLYLKRIRDNQQANMDATFNSRDASYIPIGSFTGFRDLRALGGSRRLSNNTMVSSYSSSGILGRSNSVTGLSLHGLQSSGLIQRNSAQSLNNLISTLQTGLQGISTSLDFGRLQQTKSAPQTRELNPSNNDLSGGPTSFLNNVFGGCSMDSRTQRMHALNDSRKVDFSRSGCNNFLGSYEYRENWQGSNPSVLSDSYAHDQGLLLDNAIQSTMNNMTPRQRWEEHSSISAINSLPPANEVMCGHVNQLNGSEFIQPNTVEKQAFDTHDGFLRSSFGSLDDIINAIDKPLQGGKERVDKTEAQPHNPTPWRCLYHD